MSVEFIFIDPIERVSSFFIIDFIIGKGKVGFP